MASTMTLALRKAALDRLVAVGGPLATPTLILFKNELTINKRTVIADLEECDFTGYADADALVFGAAYQDDADKVFISAPSHAFLATADTITNTVYGWAIVNAGKTALYYAEQFPEPISVNEAGDGFVVQPTIPYGS